MSSRATTRQVAASTLSLPADTYIYSLAQTSSGCAVISSDDSLRIFDPSNLTLLHTAAKAHNGLTCLQADSQGRGYVTAGRDGTVKCWDERAKTVGAVMTDSRGQGLTALACREHLVAAGTENLKEGLGNVSVLLWDMRNAAQPLRQYTESHNDTVTQLAFHPSRPQTLLSAATDGLVSIFDATIEDEDDALVQVLNHRGAVHCAGFLTEDEVYAISSDEQLSVYTLSKPSDPEDAALPISAFGDVREQLQSSYVIDVYPGSGSPPAWVAAGNTESAKMTMIPLKPSWSFDMEGALDFAGAHGEELVRGVLIDSQNQRILTCGEDGHVRLWAQEGGSTQADPDAMQTSSAEGGKKQRRKDRKDKKKSEKDRFNPY